MAITVGEVMALLADASCSRAGTASRRVDGDGAGVHDTRHCLVEAVLSGAGLSSTSVLYGPDGLLQFQAPSLGQSSRFLTLGAVVALRAAGATSGSAMNAVNHTDSR